MEKVNKNSAFNKFMCDWQRFDDGTYVLSAELFPTKEDALQKLHDEFDDWGDNIIKDYTLDDISDDMVRFCCQGIDYENGEPACMWWLGARDKKGAKPVWTYRLKFIPQKPSNFTGYNKTIQL